MLDQRRAGLGAVAGDGVDDPGRESRLLEQRHELQRRCRGVFGGFDHRGIARRERRRQLPRQQQQRRIPRRDHADHTERLIAREVEDIGLVGRNDGAFHLVGEAAIVAVPLRQILHLRKHLGIKLAVVAHLDLREMLRILFDQIREPDEMLAPRGRLGGAPSVEGFLRGGDGTVDVLPRSFGNLRPGLAGIGIDALKPALRRRRDRGAGNEMIVTDHPTDLLRCTILHQSGRSSTITLYDNFALDGYGGFMNASQP